jgi:hypothetical protein
MKNLGINQAKHVQDLYKENFKTLMKEIKDLNTWRNNTAFYTPRSSSSQLDPQI